MSRNPDINTMRTELYLASQVQQAVLTCYIYTHVWGPVHKAKRLYYNMSLRNKNPCMQQILWLKITLSVQYLLC